MPGNIAKQQRNRFLLYALLICILFCGISLLQWINNRDVDIYYFFAQVLALMLGIVHISVLNYYLKLSEPDEFGKGLLITVIIMLIGAIFAALLYYFTHLKYSFITFIFPFVIPYLFWQTYRFFLQIPRREYKLWYYPLDRPMPDLDMIDLSQIQVVQFVFLKKVKDVSEINFTSRAPLNMTLGDLFFIFINDYNERNSQNTIEFLGERNRPYGWLFYRKRKWFRPRRYFDPELSFRENAIQPNEFIYSKRIDKGL